MGAGDGQVAQAGGEGPEVDTPGELRIRVRRRDPAGTTAPAGRRAEVAELGMKSVFAGLLSTCATAALVGMLV